MIARGRYRGRSTFDQRAMDRPHVQYPLAGIVLSLALLLASCGGLRSGVQKEPVSDDVREFRATHTECNRSHFREPCQIGPDGKLYRYNPGEKGRPPKK